MRAVGLMVHGGPEVLQVVDVPAVEAGPGQVRIRNYAAAVNPTDVVGRNGMRAEVQKNPMCAKAHTHRSCLLYTSDAADE